MSDLISRQAAIDEIDEWIKAFRENGHKESAADARLIKDGVIQLLSVQPEIVRCKDCAHNCGELDGYICCDTTEEISIWHSEDWFCADGERKDDA